MTASDAPHPDASGAVGRTAAEREAARLRWELARLHSRRSVRAALLATGMAGARRGGARDVAATLRGRRVVEDLDVIAPATTRPRPAYPHLDVVHLAAVGAFGAAAPHRRVGPVAGGGEPPASPDAIRHQPPDLVVLDDLAGLARWSGDDRAALRDALPAAGAVVGLVTDDAAAAEAAAWPCDVLLVAPWILARRASSGLPETTPCLPGLPGIDPAVDRPVGWRRTPERPAVVCAASGDAEAARLAADLGLEVVTSPERATDAAAVIVTDAGTWAGVHRILALTARGLPVLLDELAEVPAGLEGLVERARPERMLAAAGALADDLDHRERTSVRRRRQVLRDHGHRARLEPVLAHLGVPLRRAERISVLLATRRPDHLDAAVAAIAAQDHPDVEVVAALHGDGFPDDAEARVADLRRGPTRVVRVAGSAPLGDVLNAALDEATGTLVAKMDDDDLYGPGHLSDLLVALDYSGADVVGRWSNETHMVAADVTIAQDLDRQERWAHHLPGATMLVRGDVLRAVRFRRVPRHVDTHLLRSIHAAGGTAYATHRFGFLRRRHGDHTYEATEGRFASDAGARPGLDESVLHV